MVGNLGPHPATYAVNPARAESAIHEDKTQTPMQAFHYPLLPPVAARSPELQAGQNEGLTICPR
jgi:hypothetical protein